MDLRRVEESVSRHSKLISESEITVTLLEELKTLSLSNLEKFKNMNSSERLHCFAAYTEFQDTMNHHLLQINCKLESFINDISKCNNATVTKQSDASLQIKSYISSTEEIVNVTVKTVSDHLTSPDINVGDIKSFIQNQDVLLNNESSNSMIIKKPQSLIPEEHIRNVVRDQTPCTASHQAEKNIENSVTVSEKAQQVQHSSNLELRKRACPTVNLQCSISHIENPGHFYINIIEEEIGILESLEMQLNECYSMKNRGFMDKEIAKKTMQKYCVAYDEQWREWYRGEILDWELSGEFLKCLYVDYGTQKNISYKNIRPLQEEFFHIPIMAQRCHFAYLYPPGSTSKNKLPESAWPKESTELFLQFVNDTKSQLFQLSFVDEEEECDSLAVDIFPLNGSEDNLNTIGLDLINAGAAAEVLPENTDMIQNQLLIDQICTAQGIHHDDDANWTYEDDEEESNVNVAVTGYDPKDEANMCKFIQPDGTCYKKFRCHKSHEPLRPDGFTTDKERVYAEAFNSLILPKTNEARLVVITHVVNIKTFYVQIKNDPFQLQYCDWGLVDLVSNLNAPESLRSLRTHKYPPAIGQIVVALHWSGEWHRGRVENLFLPHQDRDAMAEISFVDYGDVHEVRLKDLREITKQYLFLPFQFPIYTSDVTSIQSEPHCPLLIIQTEIAFDKIIFSGNAVDVMHIQLMNDKGEDVGEQLIAAGYALNNEKLMHLKETETILVD